jgi:hypothetical protein
MTAIVRTSLTGLLKDAAFLEKARPRLEPAPIAASRDAN